MRGDTDRLDQFLDKLVAVLGHKDREVPCRDYCLGLLLDRDRKSMEPMAARSDEAVLAAVRDWVLPELTPAGPLEAWIVDGEPDQRMIQ